MRPVPRSDLLAGLVEDVGPEGLDQAGLLGDGDELGGGDEPALGVLPAHQGLNAEHGGASETHDGLVVDAQFTALKGATQIGLDFEAFDGSGPHAALERLDAIAAPLLGPVHGGVGVA